MNFLAHLYLSGHHPEVMVGNFIGDFVKGRSLATRYSPGVVLGIELHRAIDHFTDTHAVVRGSKKRLYVKYRHYAGVIVDVFYDHFLASNWAVYHSKSLTDFARESYQVLQDHDSILPEEVKHMLPYMIKGNWLVNYQTIEGVHRALSGMASRTPYLSKMEEASGDLREHHALFGQEFESFFPQLKEFCASYLESRQLP